MTPRQNPRLRQRSPAGRVAVAALAGLVALACWSAVAQAGPPSHPVVPGDPIGGFALNKACGAATDSSGNIYVSSAGNDAVEVFDPAGTHLATIPADAPCGLAVDSAGRVFVSQSASGNVVRYTPDVYPFVGVPLYGAPTTVDSSAQAKGIAVDPRDDRLYVAKGDHVAAYQSDGTLGVNELQRVRVVNATGGTYTLSFRGQTTAPIPFNASAAQLQAALEALPTIGAGNIAVSPSPVDPGNRVYDVTFTGALAGTDVETLVVDDSALTGGTASAFAQAFELVRGWDGIIGAGELTDATGVAAYTSGSGDLFVSVADDGSDLVRIFAAPGVHSGTGGFVSDIKSLALRHTIDGSETPDGDIGFGAAGAQLAVDGASGHLFVYDHADTAVDEFEATGRFFSRIDDAGFADAEPSAVAIRPQRDEVQLLTINATGGSFRLSFEGEQTAALPHDPTTAQLQAALEALSSIGTGNVAVNRAVFGGPLRIRFTGVLGSRDVSQLVADGSGLTGGTATATVTDEAQGSGPGRVYVTAGAGPGAALIAFGPVAPARRPSRPEPPHSFELKNANAIAVDSGANRYVADDVSVKVYDTSGAPRTTLFGSAHPRDLAVDSAGNLYVLDIGHPSSGGDEEVHLYTPAAGFSFSGPTVVATTSSFGTPLNYIGVNPANDHLFLGGARSEERDSAANGLSVVNASFAGGLPGLNSRSDIAVHSATGNVYLAAETAIRILDPTGTKIISTIDGSGSPRGRLGGLNGGGIAVEQASGHVLVHDVSFTERRVVEEYEPSGAFVADFGQFALGGESGIAIDESGGPNDGNVYVAHSDHVNAFGALSYGEPPAPLTETASGIGGGAATLNGTLDPRGFPVSDCHFEYTDVADFDANGFAAAESEPCAETLPAIGSGESPINVHADIDGLDPDGRYRFRLVAANEFGSAASEPPGVFGPPLLSTKPAQPVLYTEASVRAQIDPFGLATTYRVEYGSDGPCAANSCSSTPERTLTADAGESAVKVPLSGLAEGTTYHYRVLAANAAGSATGSDQTLTTLARPATANCPNAEFRTGPSAKLPDCRAYELVTPADMRGGSPYATDHGDAGAGFNNWLVAPRGEGAGDSVAYFVDQPLPGFDGNGLRDGYRATRGVGGWTSAIFSPSFTQAGGGYPNQQGVAADQRYVFWQFTNPSPFEPTLGYGYHLRTPAGFEPVGRGSLGSDLDAEPRFVGAGGSHVIFASEQNLEPEAPPAGTRAIYDRAAGAASAHVVSLLPGEVTQAAGQDATYVGTTEAASAIAFKLGGALYVRRANTETVKVADAPNSFAGFSEDGGRVFYSDAAKGDQPGDLFAFDLSGRVATAIAPESIFVNVSADGSHVYFTSRQALGDAPLPADLSDKLYVWDGSAVRFIAVLDPADFGAADDGIDHWSLAVGANIGVGRARSPTRSTRDGDILVFESRARLTAYDNEDFTQVYRYDAAAPPGAQLSCVSCTPTGVPATVGARLQSFTTSDNVRTPTFATTLIPNVTDDGAAVFFDSADPLVPEDANMVTDVYEWKAQGTRGCARAGGCLALISAGISDKHSFLYGMTADGEDVFFRTLERLHGADIANGSSLYDARINGGFPAPTSAPPCTEDACQGDPSPPPPAPTVASVTFAGVGNGEATRPTPKVRVVRKAVRGMRIRLRVRVPGAGVIAARGRNLKRARKKVTEAGTHLLTVRLTKKAVRALKRRKTLKLRVRVRFAPTEGEASQATVRVTMKQPVRKRTRRARTASHGGRR